jgi:type IV pilus assembly protein PilC
MRVSDEAVLSRRLHSMGYTLTALQTSAPVAHVGSAGARGTRVASASRHLFLRQLATATKAGLPLYDALTRIAETVADRAMGTVAREMAARVERGGRLSEAFAAHPTVFSEGVVGLIAAAEMGGFLDLALVDLADDAERGERVTRETRRAIRYTTGTLLAALLLGLPLAGFIAPMIRTLLITGDRTRAIGAGVEAAASTLLWVVLAIIGGVVGGRILFRRLVGTPRGALRWDSLLLRAPFLGLVYRCASRASFLGALARLTHAGVGSTGSWESAIGAADNRAVKEALHRALPLLETGGRLSDALAASGIATPGEVGLIANGEATGHLEGSLEQLAERSRWELESSLRQLPMVAHIAGYALAAPIVGYAVARFYLSYYGSILQSVDEAFGH